MSQLAFLVADTDVLSVVAARLDLVKDALDDAAAWREHLEDGESADAYQELAAAIERAEDAITEPGAVA
jgi:hypothetical protein